MKIQFFKLFFPLLLISFVAKAQSSFLAEQGVAVFCPADMDSVRTLPSLALVKNLQPQGSVPDNWKTRPVFSKINGKLVLYGKGKSIPLTESASFTVCSINRCVSLFFASNCSCVG